jgi:hypothetical protein
LNLKKGLPKQIKNSYTKGMRDFNTTGLCVPDMHYMDDISGKIDQIRPMIEKRQYFTINRGRQYGKTTMLNALENVLADEYIMVKISFEGIGDAPFESEEKFVDAFMLLIQNALEWTSIGTDTEYIESWYDKSVNSIMLLSNHIKKMCKGKKRVLMIDEVDASSGYRVYIRFLGMLRDKFLARTAGKDYTFHSVILAGVYDIKNIKLKMKMTGVYTPSPEEGGIYNSPWNIAVPFDVDMSFSAPEIATMLREYETDHQTGMDIKAVSEKLREWTSGYPFLVSRLCQIIDRDLEKNWTPAGVESAVKIILQEQNTLFDDMIKNMEMFKDLYDYIYKLLIIGVEMKESTMDPIINRGLMFSFLKSDNGQVFIANKIFEKLLIDYFISKDDTVSTNNVDIRGVVRCDVVKNGRFNMELAIKKFAEHFREIYTKKDFDFWETHARLVFLSYLKPLINGEGFYHLESQFTDTRRMDIVVDFGTDQFIIELKLWHGETAEDRAYDQLTGYLNTKGTDTGYLVCFDTRKELKPREGWIEKNGCRIYEVVL